MNLLCEAVQHSDRSDGREGHRDCARREASITCLGNIEQQRTKKKEEQSLRGLGSRCVYPPPLFSLICTHRHTLSLCLSLLPSLFSLLYSPMLVWWTAGHSWLSCMEAQGGAGSPGKSHFLFSSFVNAMAFLTSPKQSVFIFSVACAVNSPPAVSVFLHDTGDTFWTLTSLNNVCLMSWGVEPYHCILRCV